MVFWLICSCFKPTPFIGWMYYILPLSVASIFTILMASVNKQKLSVLISSTLSVFSTMASAFCFFRNVAYPRSCRKLTVMTPVLASLSTPLRCSFHQEMESVPPPPSGMSCDLFWPKLETLLCRFEDWHFHGLLQLLLLPSCWSAFKLGWILKNYLSCS